MRHFSFCLVLLSMTFGLQAQYWQQAVNYEMDIDFDVASHQFKGKQKLTYTNNSPDVLDRVFYHLYFNAFQPGSMMDVRSRTIKDPDARVGDRISKLSQSEIGYQKIASLTQDGEPVKFEVVGTILEVELAKPIAPNSKTVLEMQFSAQVPKQIRRSGRNNAEGIEYSMTQWYPKLSEYDHQGWHANPYVGREFHGVWGDFDVKITIDNSYLIGGTGYLQNPDQIGHGYQADGKTVSHTPGQKLTWHFKAPNVHDFAWAADPDYTHTKLVRKDGVTLHFLYEDNERTTDNWKALPSIMDAAMDFVNNTYGKYPYKQYSFLQGGDGGMEYAMATLITGERNINSLVGVSVHELMHSWYQMNLGTNEALYAWMDEGFTSFASARVMNYLRSKGFIPGVPDQFPHARSYAGYGNLVASGVEEPLTTHADHFETNFAYGQAAYSKGAVFLSQIEYIIGKEAFDKGMLRYFDEWAFKHPTDIDFLRVMEKESGLELDWYREYFVQTTKTIDYAVDQVAKDDKKTTRVKLSKKGVMPMPIDLVVTMTDGEKKYITIPLQMMRGAKENDGSIKYSVFSDWAWTNADYELVLPYRAKKIESVEIDPSQRLADINKANNKMEGKKGKFKALKN